MKFPDKLYTVLKWLCLICLPAVSTFLFAVGSIFNWPYTEQITGVIAAVITLIGALIGVSTKAYNKEIGNTCINASKGEDENADNE